MKDFFKGFIPLFIAALIPCLFIVFIVEYGLPKIIEIRYNRSINE
jgi:hypothetical protein